MEFREEPKIKRNNKSQNNTLLENINLCMNYNLDEEYKLARNTNHYKSFFEKYIGEQKNLKDEVFKLDKNGILYEIVKEIKEKFNTKILFNSVLHGYMHNERVIFLSRMIAHYEELPKESMQILMDAAKYHDIGRKNDAADEGHGFRSSAIIENIIRYSDIQDFLTLKYIIMCHSIDDEYGETIINESKIADKERAITLLRILKDADNLDRVRLNLKYNKLDSKMYFGLNPNYLRTKTGKSLVKLAYELYNYYYQNTVKNDVNYSLKSLKI